MVRPGLPRSDALGEPAVDLVAPMPYTELQQIMDAGAPAGNRDYFKGGFISDVSDEFWSFQVLSLWDDPAQDEEQKACTRAAADTISSYSEMVSYPNFLSADEAVDVRWEGH